MFVIVDYPYGRKNPKMYLIKCIFSCGDFENSSEWTFNEKKAIKFEKKEFAEMIAKLNGVKGVVEKCI